MYICIYIYIYLYDDVVRDRALLAHTRSILVFLFNHFIIDLTQVQMFICVYAYL